jgi:hypothetical protein
LLIFVLSRVSKRGDLTVAFYDNINYSGRSYGYTGDWNQCHNMPSYMDKKASSVSMGYTTGCRIWDAPDCKELSYYLAGGQDWKNLDTVGWNDFARSFSCTPA